jgi:hypothetical protein
MSSSKHPNLFIPVSADQRPPIGTERQIPNTACMGCEGTIDLTSVKGQHLDGSITISTD